jgi:hypothetical protein
MEAILDVSQWENFIAELGNRNRKASDYLRLAVETKGRADVLDHFRASQGPSGPWPARKPATQQAYANYASGRWRVAGHASKYNPSNLLLVLSGRLRQSIQPGGREGGVRIIDRTSVLLFSSVEYSRVHDEGYPAKGIPKRTFMWLSDPGKEAVAEVFLGALTEGL